MRTAVLVVLAISAGPAPVARADRPQDAATGSSHPFFLAGELGFGSAVEYYDGDLHRAMSTHLNATAGLRIPIGPQAKLGPTVGAMFWGASGGEVDWSFGVSFGVRGWWQLRPKRTLDLAIEYLHGSQEVIGASSRGLGLSVGGGTSAIGLRLHVDVNRFREDYTHDRLGPAVNVWVGVEARQGWALLAHLAGLIVLVQGAPTQN